MNKLSRIGFLLASWGDVSETYGNSGRLASGLKKTTECVSVYFKEYDIFGAFSSYLIFVAKFGRMALASLCSLNISSWFQVPRFIFFKIEDA